MPTRRCANAGCGRFVPHGQRWCGRHAGDADAAFDVFEVDETPENESEDEFKRRLLQREYRQLYDAGMPEVMAQAAGASGLTDEIGILRVVLARLLMTEGDPNQLAESVARVAGVAVQAARAQRVIGGTRGESIADAINVILAELDDEG